MKTVQQLERLKAVHRLIEAKKTGTPDQLASKLNVSRRYVFRLVDQIRALGGEIAFSRRRKTYYYSNKFKLVILIKVKTKSDGIVTQIVKV